MKISNKQKLLTGLALIALGLLVNQWSLALITHKCGTDYSRVYLWVFQLLMIIEGIGIIFINKIKSFFKFIFAQFFIFCILFAASICFEAYLIMSKWEPKENKLDDVFAYYLEIDYKAHPLFFSFYDDKALNMKNKMISIDPRGFRGALPEEAGKKKLAFLLGGSTAFGCYSLSDDTTVTGFLNKFQDEYFFVNAAVPGYNSTQEYLRLSFELIEYKPDLVIFLNGFNDCAYNYTYDAKNKHYVNGTPSCYEKIDDIINKNMGEKYKEDKPLKKILKLYHLKLYLRDLISRSEKKQQKQLEPKNTAGINFDRIKIIEDTGAAKKTEPIAVTKKVATSAADYIKNMKLIKAVCQAYNIKQIAIFQPNLFLHASISEEDKFKLPKTKKEFETYSLQFHSYVKDNAGFIYDFGSIFDKYSKTFPGKDIFYDTCHFTDTGNKIIAEEILELMKKEKLLNK